MQHREFEEPAAFHFAMDYVSENLCKVGTHFVCEQQEEEIAIAAHGNCFSVLRA